MTEHSRHAAAHIESIVKQEEEALERRSASERLADTVGSFAGSLPFVVLHLAVVTMWLLVNSGLIASVRPFDPLAIFIAWSDRCRRGGHTVELHTHEAESHDAAGGTSRSSELASGLVGREGNHNAVADGTCDLRQHGT